MLIKLVLRLLACAAPILRRLGIDVGQFLAILETKLTLDTRRQTAGYQGGDTKRKPSNKFAATLVFYAIMGILIAMTLTRVDSPLVGLSIVNGFVMMMLAMSLIADFSSVLLDATDNAVLQPRPVTGRTLFAARVAHIVTYLSLLALSLSAATFVVGAWTIHPLFPLVYLVMLACAVALVVTAVNVFYLVALRFTDGEKFRDIILYFQIGVTVLVLGGYQILPHVTSYADLGRLTIADRWWIYLSPPTWMAAPVDLLAGNLGVAQWVLSAMAIVVPLAGILLVLRVFAPQFNRALARLEAAPSGSTSAVKRVHSLETRLSRLVSRSPVRRAAFVLIWKLGTRDRQFKLRAYSSMAFLLVFVVILMLNTGEGWRHAAPRSLGQSQRYFIVLYVGCAFIATLIMQLRYSNQPTAAWIYEALPLARPGDVMLAGLEAVLLRFVLPPLIMVGAGCLAIWGWAILPDVILAACVTLLLGVVQAMLFGRSLPFAEAFNVTEASGRFGRSMLTLILPAALGGLHYLLKLAHPAAVPGAIPAVLLLTWFLARIYARTDWPALRAAR